MQRKAHYASLDVPIADRWRHYSQRDDGYGAAMQRARFISSKMMTSVIHTAIAAITNGARDRLISSKTKATTNRRALAITARRDKKRQSPSSLVVGDEAADVISFQLIGFGLRRPHNAERETVIS